MIIAAFLVPVIPKYSRNSFLKLVSDYDEIREIPIGNILRFESWVVKSPIPICLVLKLVFLSTWYVMSKHITAPNVAAQFLIRGETARNSSGS